MAEIEDGSEHAGTPRLEDSPYFALPQVGPLDVGVGHALITMVGPTPSYAHEYNRWYEDDHFLSGAMFGPWMFAGRRWSAPDELRQLRFPAHSPIVEPVTSGWYLGTYWIAPGRLADHQAWIHASNLRLAKEGRIFEHRVPGFTSYQDLAGTTYRDASVPDARWALMDPAPGIVLEVIDASRPELRDDLERWLLSDHLPARLAPVGPATLAMVFRTHGGLHASMRPKIRAAMERLANGCRRLSVLWFLDVDPRECWADLFSAESTLVSESGLGTVSFAGPFIPSKMGTNAYVDEMLPRGR